jgi:hypothetical protein
MAGKRISSWAMSDTSNEEEWVDRTEPTTALEFLRGEAVAE